MPVAKKAASEAAAEETTSTQAGSRAEGDALPVTASGEVLVPRSDDDALTGHFANIVSGEFAPRYVVVGDTLARDADGFPTKVRVKTRDDRDELLEVDYADLRPAPAGQR